MNKTIVSICVLVLVALAGIFWFSLQDTPPQQNNERDSRSMDKMDLSSGTNQANETPRGKVAEERRNGSGTSDSAKEEVIADKRQLTEIRIQLTSDKKDRVMAGSEVMLMILHDGKRVSSDIYDYPELNGSILQVPGGTLDIIALPGLYDVTMAHNTVAVEYDRQTVHLAFQKSQPITGIVRDVRGELVKNLNLRASYGTLKLSDNSLKSSEGVRYENSSEDLKGKFLFLFTGSGLTPHYPVKTDEEGKFTLPGWRHVTTKIELGRGLGSQIEYGVPGSSLEITYNSGDEAPLDGFETTGDFSLSDKLGLTEEEYETLREIRPDPTTVSSKIPKEKQEQLKELRSKIMDHLEIDLEKLRKDLEKRKQEGEE